MSHHHTRRNSDASMLRVAILLGLAALPLTTTAATFTVSNLNNGGSGSLRDAVDQANRTTGPDTVDFAAGLTGTITLTSGQIDIFDPLTIAGPGVSRISISGNNASRIFRIGPTTPIPTAFDTAISGLKFINGLSGDEGGAIFVDDSNLSVNNCEFRGSTAQRGGALYAFPTLSTNLALRNTLFDSNTATTDGGGFGAQDIDEVNLSNVTVNGNSAARNGGGGFLRAVSVNISQSVFSSNVSSTEPPGVEGLTGGGGLRVDGSKVTAVAEITATRFVGNRSQLGQGGGLWLSAIPPMAPPTLANFTLDRVQLLNNSSGLSGGGILGRDINLSFGNGTTAGNTAAQAGGGIAFDTAGALVLSNATLAGNTSTLASGGGVFSTGTTTLSIASSSIVGNTASNGGGIRRDGAGASLRNSIVANNNAGTGPDLVGSFSPNFTLVKNANGATLAAGNGNLSAGTDPLLGPLAVNGGPTLTLLPSTASPVLNAGDTNSSGLPASDQRGLGRIVSGRIDLGSVERQSPEDVIFRGVFQ